MTDSINFISLISRECHICKEIFQKEEDLWKHHTANHSGSSLEAGNVFKDRPPVRRVHSDQKPWIPQKVAGNFKFKMDKLQSPSVSSTQVDNCQVMSDSSDSSPVPKVWNFQLVQTCSNLFKLVLTYPNLFKLVQTCKVNLKFKMKEMQSPLCLITTRL